MTSELATGLPTKAYRLPSRPGHRVALERHERSPDPNDIDAVRTWLESKPRPWAIDLFCGAGGLSLGLEEAGFTVVAAADSEATAIQSHAANIEGLTWTGDLGNPDEFIAQLSQWGIDSVDLVAGGPPCQPFSLAGVPKIGSLVKEGRRAARDSRADLWRSFFAIIDHLNPSAVLFENVQGFTAAQDGAVLVELVDQLKEREYEVHTRVLKASAVGVPQHRSRLFVVGSPKGTEFEWPHSASRRSPTLHDAIGDLPDIGPGVREEAQEYVQPDNPSRLAHSMRKGLRGAEKGIIRDHVTRAVRPDDAKIYELLPPGGTYADVPEELRRYRSDIFTDKYYRLRMDGICRTITAHMAKDGYWYIHPTQNRTLSIREAARVQTFPDKFRFAGAPSTRLRQIGNAVPPLLAKAMGKAVKETLNRIDGVPRAIREQQAAHSFQPARFRDDLLQWFKTNRRNFPWRTKRLSKWQVLLIEMCLHRTQAGQVAQVADEVLKLGRTPKLFLANFDQLAAPLSTLGLQWRVDNLARAAEYILQYCNGKVPSSRQELVSIPGVADYIASATLCFGHDKPSVLMDTNTRRIVSRVMGDDRQPANWEMRLELHRLAGEPGPDAHWNQALLDLGGTVCTARFPKCSECPILNHCATGRSSKIGNRQPADTIKAEATT